MGDAFGISIIIVTVALFVGFLVSLNDAERPTMMDVLFGTLKSSAFPAAIAIFVVFKVLT